MKRCMHSWEARRCAEGDYGRRPCAPWQPAPSTSWEQSEAEEAPCADDLRFPCLEQGDFYW